MGVKTGIGWAQGGTASHAKGCEKYGPECRECYASMWAARHQGKGTEGYEGTYANGGFTGRVNIVEREIENMRKARSAKKGLFFVCSMSDMFHKDVPEEVNVRAIEAMGANRYEKDGEVLQTHFALLTKRDAIMADFSRRHPIPDNVWCGVTVGCKASMKRLDSLRETVARVRFVSMEPLLEEVDIEPWLADGTLDWVIVGGESGNNFRPMDPKWVEKVLLACQKYGKPAFFKQWSARLPKQDAEYPPTFQGRVWEEYPACAPWLA